MFESTHFWKDSRRDPLLRGKLDEPEEGPEKDASLLDREEPEHPLQEDFEITTYEECSISFHHNHASTA